LTFGFCRGVLALNGVGSLPWMGLLYNELTNLISVLIALLNFERRTEQNSRQYVYTPNVI